LCNPGRTFCPHCGTDVTNEQETEYGIFCPKCHSDFWRSETIREENLKDFKYFPEYNAMINIKKMKEITLSDRKMLKDERIKMENWFREMEKNMAKNPCHNPGISCDVCGKDVNERSLSWVGENAVCRACMGYYSEDEIKEIMAEKKTEPNPCHNPSFEYRTISLRTVKGFNDAERLKSQGWKVISSSPDVLTFERPKIIRKTQIAKRNPHYVTDANLVVLKSFRGHPIDTMRGVAKYYNENQNAKNVFFGTPWDRPVKKGEQLTPIWASMFPAVLSRNPARSKVVPMVMILGGLGLIGYNLYQYYKK
jgi:hypothetical protein